jgi:hypothetical protein
MTNERWDSSHERKVVTLLTLAFELVGLVRWIIAPLFPAMVKDPVAEMRRRAGTWLNAI